MMEAENPYQVTATSGGEVSLGDDAEFLISRREILCREELDLPAVCLHTGRLDDLLQRRHSFQHWFRPRPSLWAVVVLLLLWGYAGRLVWRHDDLQNLAVSSAVALIVIMLARKSSDGPRRVTWYVNRSYVRRRRIQDWLMRCLLPVGAALLFLAVMTPHYGGWSRLPRDQVLFVLQACGVVGLFVAPWIRSERRLVSHGPRRRGVHRGLYSLTGHSSRFTTAVERLIVGGFQAPDSARPAAR